MSKELTRKSVPARRRFAFSRNTMSFPRALRDAIPDLPTYVGRALEIDSINGTSSSGGLVGGGVHLKVLVKETGKLKGEFVVRMDLRPEAARALAETLTRLAAEAENGRSG